MLKGKKFNAFALHNSKKFIAQQLNYARTSAVMHAHNR